MRSACARSFDVLKDLKSLLLSDESIEYEATKIMRMFFYDCNKRCRGFDELRRKGNKIVCSEGFENAGDETALCFLMRGKIFIL